MASGFFEWVGRVVMLVLAGMVTLSIIGSIASIPSGSFESRMGLQEQVPLPPEAQPPPPAPEETGRRPQAGEGAAPVPGAGPVAGTGAAPPDRAGPERWLEAITYALLALVGLAALLALLLWRGLGTRRRIAEALEELALRR